MSKLTAADIERLRVRLSEEHAALRQELAGELARSAEARHVELAGQVHDRGDEAVADLLGDLEIAGIDRHVMRIRQVEAALEAASSTWRGGRGAIAGGRYGLCRACRAPIGLARLQVDPAVPRCIQCQTLVEQGRHAPTL